MRDVHNDYGGRYAIRHQWLALKVNKSIIPALTEIKGKSVAGPAETYLKYMRY